MDSEIAATAMTDSRVSFLFDSYHTVIQQGQGCSQMHSGAGAFSA